MEQGEKENRRAKLAERGLGEKKGGGACTLFFQTAHPGIKIWLAAFPNHARTNLVKVDAFKRPYKKHNLTGLITLIDVLLTYVLQGNCKWKDGLHQNKVYRLLALFSQPGHTQLTSLADFSFSPHFTREPQFANLSLRSLVVSKLWLITGTRSATKRASYTLSGVQRNRQNCILEIWRRSERTKTGAFINGSSALHLFNISPVGKTFLILAFFFIRNTVGAVLSIPF